MADKLLAAQQALYERVLRVAEPGDLSLVLEPRAAAEQRALTAAVRRDESDLGSRYVLGWFHWYRHLALDRGDGPDLAAALDYLSFCFFHGLNAPLPVPLQLDLVDRVASAAENLLHSASESADHELVLRCAGLWEQIVKISDAHSSRAAILANAGLAVDNRFTLTGDRADLDMAVRLLEEAVSLNPEDSWNQTNLGNQLLSRYEVSGVLDDLERAIEACGAALRLSSPEDPGRPTMLSTMGHALLRRFRQIGTVADLDQAVDHFQDAAATAPHGSAERARWESNLAGALIARFERDDVLADLDLAAEQLRKAISSLPPDHPSVARMQINLGYALRTRFIRSGDPRNLEDAAAVLTAAVEAMPVGHPERPLAMLNLGAVLHTRHEYTGASADLDRAVDVLEAALSTIPAESPQRASVLASLATALLGRFERDGGLPELSRAEAYLQEAVTESHPDSPDLVKRLSSLGIAATHKFERSGAAADINAAVASLDRAVTLGSRRSTELHWSLTLLGLALRARFEQTKKPDDLDQAVLRLQQAVRLLPTGHTSLPMCLSNLGLALTARYELTSGSGDLDEAIDALERAVSAAPPDYPDRASLLVNYGNALALRDKVRAADAYEEAAKTEIAPPLTRITAAYAAAEALRGSEPERAGQLLADAIELLPQVAPRRLERADQQHALARLTGLVADGAALAHDEPARAVRLLEVGRAVLFGQALETRSDLTELRAMHPDLAARFVELRDMLDRPPNLTSPPTETTASRHHVARAWAELLATIRSLPGFASFARLPAVTELLDQAGEGPIVLFNVSSIQSNAFLVTRAGIRCLPLPGLTFDTVVEQVAAFRGALRTTTAGQTPRERLDAQQRLVDVLAWLWDNAAGPVLDELGPQEQVWWIPGGLLGLLPIHAAGRPGDAVLDRVVSSYTPTIAALRFARGRRLANAPLGTGRSLIVAMPSTPGVPGRLDSVAGEARVLVGLLPDPVLVELPTTSQVLELLPDCTVAHFACHGVSDPADPSRSRLLLSDHETTPLTVSAVAALHLDNASLAYLSACDTALTSDPRLIDEAIHLTSAFQLAGYPHVVGTLWAINDEIAARIAEGFYAEYQRVGAARALHQAIRAIRNANPRTPSLWAAHHHAGA